MTAISKTVLGDAILSVGRMDMREKELLADEVHTHQPQIFYSVLLQRRYGASLEQLEVLINALLTYYVAMKGAGREWPTVTEDVQERCLKRVTGRVRFIEGLTPEQQDEAVTTALADHREPWLLAFVFAEMRPILGIKTDAEKMLVLAALNLVECIAEAAPTSARGLRG